jgi:hypothetical protein
MKRSLQDVKVETVRAQASSGMPHYWMEKAIEASREVVFAEERYRSAIAKFIDVMRKAAARYEQPDLRKEAP